MRENQAGQNHEKNEPLREGEDKYRQLINQMLNGYALHEIICNDQGQPIDYLFLEVNPAFERMTGLKAESVVGLTVLEILPQTESSWIEKYGKVALTGESIHFENYHRQINRYFDVTAFRPAPNQFACYFTDITERKRAEEELLKTRERLELAMDAGEHGFWDWNLDTNDVYFSPCYYTMLGYEPGELPMTLETWINLMHPDDKKTIVPEVENYVKNARAYEVEFRLKTKDGDWKWISGRGKSFKKDIDGIPHRAVGVHVDITERKRAEEELLKTRERLELAMDAGEHGFWDWNLDTNDVYFSPCYYTMLGYEPGELPMTLETWINLMHPDDKKTIVPEVENYVKNARAYEVEFRLKTKDGDWKWISGRGKSFKKDIDGIPHRAVGVHVDITERKRAELALSAEKERLAVTLSSIGDGVIATDTNGNITMLNKAAEALTGWNSDEATGRPLPEVFNIINERTRQQCENPVEKVLITDDSVELANHTCLIAKDGREIVIADCSAPIRDNESRIIGVVLVFLDMTEKQKLDDVMQKSQKLESLGILAGGIAHDFNNILCGIFGYIEMAIAKTTEEEVSTCLAKSLRNIDRARALTQQLLTFAKGGAPIKKVENLFPFVQETTQFALSGSSVSSRFRIQENLWLCDFDKNQICQVIDNLTINAQQAMPNGGTIEVSARNISLSAKEHISLAAGNYVKLSIKDQGIGIPKEFLPRIFDPYYTTKAKGHGLGLSTCYSIVNRHGGCIDVASEPGKGSTFHVYLPASIESISTIAGKSAGKHTGSGTFLVMDDEEAIRNIIKIILESFGYTVVLKENGKDAIDFFVTEIKANRKLAGMIFDLTIPGGMGGKEAIGEIRKICSNTPAFVASGYSNDPIMANPEEYGFNASICKPFMKAELSEMLEKHLKKHK